MTPLAWRVTVLRVRRAEGARRWADFWREAAKVAGYVGEGREADKCRARAHRAAERAARIERGSDRY